MKYMKFTWTLTANDHTPKKKKKESSTSILLEYSVFYFKNVFVIVSTKLHVHKLTSSNFK